MALWYHDTMDQKAMTLRLSNNQAKELALAATVRGTSVAQEVRDAIAARIEELRRDEVFQARLRESLERNRELLESLAST